MTIRSRWSSLPQNSKLAVVALALGALSLFADPYPRDVVAVDVKDLTTLIQTERDHVTAEDLARWIVEGRSDYRLVDLRSEADYAGYHIPAAQNLPLSAFTEAGLPHAERIVLYSDGGIHAYQAWMLMRGMGYKSVYTLKGGLDEWKTAVLFPVPPQGAAPADVSSFERRAALARFFGGSAGAAGSEVSRIKTPELPKIEAPAAAPGSGSLKPRKKKEGC
jgi:rhodanese-related sulfurtransferase